MKADRVINQAIWEHQANTKGFPNYEYLNDLEKLRKALEIIKEKTLTINDLYWLKNGNYKEYRKNLEVLYSGVEEEHLLKILKTQEEYELLKEVLL